MRFLAANSNLDEAQIVILGAPLEATETWRGGPSQAPQAIRYASDSVESFSVIFMRDMADLKVHDAGDLDCSGELEAALANIESTIRGYFHRGKRVLLLGGEHTVTLPALRAAISAFGPTQLLVLDAHTDLRDEYDGQRISHATVTRRCSELAERVVIVGARSFYGGEFELLHRFNIHFASPRYFIRFLNPALPVYLSLDLDVLDASQCPGVTNPEPGGLSYWEVIEVFKALRGHFKVVAVDIVELSPPYDPSGVSAVCAAKLAVEGIIAIS
ncbi:MAG: agmatinase [Chloroflexi bacterium]|nr:MAG: agmatinase [Chloroflexota bacterium]